MEAPVLETAKWSDYELVDCGDGRKLERFGSRYLIRGEPKAWWRANSQLKEWKQADAENLDNGSWVKRKESSRDWPMQFKGVSLEARMTDMSKHVGVFPEQEPHWTWLARRLAGLSHPSVLNLFGYTGMATLVCALNGAHVTHVDASKPALSWARQNQALSNLSEKPIRWILDDAFKFVAREVKRKRQYDAILLDPPSFGRGPKGEIWKVESQIVELLINLRKILNPSNGMLVLTMYNLEASSIMLANLVQDIFKGGKLEYGELGLQCTGSAHVLPLSLFCRWEKTGK
jgi:23S rRNA (cytosine1962-C5)-methyltransferase